MAPPNTGLMPPVSSGQLAGKSNVSLDEANAKAKKATEAKKAADEAAEKAQDSLLKPEFRAARDARIEADKADVESRQAQLEIQQARANAVLERKLGRKLREGEYARWISGDHNNMRMENVELCSPAILETEARTGVHVSDEDLVGLEDQPTVTVRAAVHG